jgi:hypothetical protein
MKAHVGKRHRGHNWDQLKAGIGRSSKMHLAFGTKCPAISVSKEPIHCSLKHGSMTETDFRLEFHDYCMIGRYVVCWILAEYLRSVLYADLRRQDDARPHSCRWRKPWDFATLYILSKPDGTYSDHLLHNRHVKKPHCFTIPAAQFSLHPCSSLGQVLPPPSLVLSYSSSDTHFHLTMAYLAFSGLRIS